jgi:hypothetical protein
MARRALSIARRASTSNRPSFVGFLKLQPGGTICARTGWRFPENRLVRAAREQGHQHHQIGKCKQPLFRLIAGSFRRSCDDAQMAAPREVMNMLHADPRQAGYFCIRKDFLARLYSNQRGLSCFLRRTSLNTLLDVPGRLKDTESSCNSRSVLFAVNEFTSTLGSAVVLGRLNGL